MKNIMEKLRQWVSTLSLKFVSAPYLPSGFIWSALLLAYTDWITILLSQPAGYWFDRTRALSNFGWLENLLSVGIWAYLLAALLYLALLWFILTILTRSFALILWMPVSFVHLSRVITWALERSSLVDRETANPLVAVGIGAATAFVLGILLVKILIDRAQPYKEQTRLQRWLQRLVPGAWVLGLIAVVSISAAWPRGGWMQIHPEHTPGLRASSAVAYDPVRERVVLFGGLSEWIGNTFYHERDTWEWDGNDWIEMKPKTLPPARAGHMMAYDEKRGVVVMFGGEEKTGNYMLADTWTWDGKDWTLMTPTGYPAARRGGQMFYDPETEKVILSGGHYYAAEKVFTYVNDIWAWDGKNWEYVTTLEDNLITTTPNVVYDPIQKRATLFDYRQLMTWTGKQWQTLEAGAMPPSRFGTWLAGDPSSGKMILFGGIDNKVHLTDTWMFEGGVWKELHPDLMPTPRDGYVMFFDPDRNSFILYGGLDGSTLDDIWEYVLP